MSGITRIDRQTVFVSLEKKHFPIHESRVLTFFGDMSMPPEIYTHDQDEHSVIESSQHNPPTAQLVALYNRAITSDLLNLIFCVRNTVFVEKSSLTRMLSSTAKDLLGFINPEEFIRLDTFISFSDTTSTFITSQERINGATKLPRDQRKPFL